jgi:hypothetical protein
MEETRRTARENESASTTNSLDSGLSWSAARELVRVAVPQTEQTWLEAARDKTLRQLEELVAGKAPGDTPNAPYRPEARRHVLRFGPPT